MASSRFPGARFNSPVQLINDDGVVLGQWGNNAGTDGSTQVLNSSGVTLGGMDASGNMYAASSRLGSATPGAAGSSNKVLIRKTAIVDNTATAVLTVTVPNVNAAAAIKMTMLANPATTADAYESARVAEGNIVVARVAGGALAAAASTLAGAQIATVTSGITITLAYAVGATVGGNTATQTFTVTVTIVASAGTPTHNLTFLAEVINDAAGGVTIAAA